MVINGKAVLPYHYITYEDVEEVILGVKIAPIKIRGENVGGNKREKTLVHIILYLNPKGLAQVNLKRNLEQFSRIVQSILSTVPFEWLKT